MRRAVAAAVLAAAALSLLGPGIPTYDPFAWINWGREILHGDLSTTTGPSWKPLPVAFTTVFAIFGGAAPWLWLIVARAGAIAAVIAAYRLVRRLGGGVAGGVGAAVAIALAPWWLMNGGLGNSEGLMAMFVFAAIERELAGERRQAFLLGCGAALLRPESWPFLAVYGLWLLWRRELRPALVVGSGIFVLACWLLPEWWGSGDPWRAAGRARTGIRADAPTNADAPVLAVFEESLRMLTIPLGAGLAAAAIAVWRRRDRALAAVAVLALLWLFVVGLMTSGGFSGNQRYLIAPVALLIVLAGAGAGRVLGERRSASPVLALTVAILFALPLVGKIELTWNKLDYQRRMTTALPGLIEDAGGREAILRCGFVSTGRYLTPQVAWYLRIHQEQSHQYVTLPGTVFEVRTTASSGWAPPGAADVSSPVAGDSRWRVRRRCAS